MQGELEVVYVVDVLRAGGRELRHVARASTPTHGALRDRIVVIFAATVTVDLVCAVLALLLERHVKATQIQSYGSALFWTTTQLLTVSSSVQNPLSTGGRILDVVMEAYAIIVVATLAGSIGTFMLRRSHERDTAEGRAPATAGARPHREA
ncbi:MAG: hypothetical protein M3016_07060 [Actinomycetota bacterium]|nr:hypothetical protein [Actinomycetota bacterium]